ncbi:3-hydroxyacyl-ACP dehydratase FabZ family protein [Micromonospora profundi]|uniref:3-hydroxyacyl-ACP dehydratase FabZ family protein n=1 Tax=Micromonospora profundi TaxID=1420889 RepID=UPI0037F4E2B7
MTRAVASPLCDADMVRLDSAGAAFTVRVPVRGDDPYLRGHFPDLAVFPGVFVVEALCRAMAGAAGDRPPELAELRSVRFLAPLLDGDTLTLQVRAEESPGGWDVRAVAYRADGTTTAKLRAFFAAAGAGDG